MSLSQTKKDYKDVAARNKKKTYESWISESGSDSESNYTDALAASETEEKLSLPTYGSRAEALSTMGLSASGYSEYLKAAAARSTRSAIRSASDALFKSEYENKSGYAEYVEGYNREQKRLGEEITGSIIEKRVFDIEKAYAIAMDAGLSEENALTVSAAAIKRAKETTSAHVLKYANDNYLSARQTRAYAQSLGLDEKSISAILDQIYRLDDEDKSFYSSMSAEDYLEYLKKQSAKK